MILYVKTKSLLYELIYIEILQSFIFNNRMIHRSKIKIWLGYQIFY